MRSIRFLPRMVTFVPRAEKKWAYSEARYPPPRMMRLSGGRCSERTETLSRYPASARPGMGGTSGLDPEAMKIRGEVICWSPILIRKSPTNSPHPRYQSRPSALSADLSMPRLPSSTTARIRLMMRSKSILSTRASTPTARAASRVRTTSAG